MLSKSVLPALLVALTAAIALPAAAQTSLPANVQSDRTTLQQDRTAVKNAMEQLRTDEATGNASAAAADRTALRLAHMKVAQDFGQLHQDAQPILQPDQAALANALNKLLADQRAGNSSAVQADLAAVTAAETQLKTDRTTVFGGLGGGFGHRGWMHHGA